MRKLSWSACYDDDDKEGGKDREVSQDVGFEKAGSGTAAWLEVDLASECKRTVEGCMVVRMRVI